MEKFNPVIGNAPARHVEPMEVYHPGRDEWFKALRFELGTTVVCPQPMARGLGWGFRFRGIMQGFTRCRRCSVERWETLAYAPR